METTVSPLDEKTIEDFRANGYIALPDVLSAEEIAGACASFSQIVRERVHRGSAAASDNVPMVQFEPGFDPGAAEVDPDKAELLVRKFMWFVKTKPALGALVQPDHFIVRVVSQLIGPAPILFQDMALIKPPFIGSQKPWHQDNAYFSFAPLDSICGVWIALDDVDVDNGCMHVLPGWHKDGPLIHHHGSDCEIATNKLAIHDVVPVPMAAGGAMFFYGMLPHYTPPNKSPRRRRALQFHFRSANTRRLPDDEYNAVYAENGAPASCAAARRGSS